ncbi:hypothetical protein BJY04DRAFT_161844 [Aspergillus karnatakaensis]|uniref:Gfo/Idh/MocA family protein n=1 Tax=Aspergillus karnatakaensis TaxID=1810916 RepID=UPI003CCE4271
MAPHNVKWGILATGGIADSFVRDLLLDPSARDAADISHTVVAVSSSSSAARAEKFIADAGIPSPCAAYGSYEALVTDPNVDVVYVATPHSHHFQNVMLVLEAGKHVLCEKAFTVNAEQTRILVETARKKNLFLMEAVWTRYFPLSIEVRNLIKKGVIGEVLRVSADNSFGDKPEEKFGTEHRMVNKDLAGGALLDLGIYSLTWVFQTLYHTLPKESRKPPSKVSAHITPYHLTGADEATTILLTFPTTTPSNDEHPGESQAIATTHLRVWSDPDQANSARPAIRIQGTKGEIQVDGPAFRPEVYRIIPLKGGEVKEKKFTFPTNGRGMYYEADEVARCLRDGKLESEGLPWEESIVIMDVMDEARRQNGLAYPEKIESTVYPTQL